MPSPSDSGSHLDLYPASEPDDPMDTDSTDSLDSPRIINGSQEKILNQVSSNHGPKLSATTDGTELLESRISLKRKLERITSTSLDHDSAELAIINNNQDEAFQSTRIESVMAKRARASITSPLHDQDNSVLGPPHDLDERVHGLTTPVWQQVLCFVPPVFLGRLLRVSRNFRLLLEPQSQEEHRFHDLYTGHRGFLSPESIWQASRKKFAPGLPKPLIDQQELQMWRLIRGNRCQDCGLVKDLVCSSSSADLWHCGPGQDGMRVIWIFGLRVCGPCLLSNCEQVCLFTYTLSV